MRQVTTFDCDIAEHKPWFEMIQDEDHWKNPISAVVPKYFLEKFERAARFYTTAGLQVVKDHGNGMVEVYGPGYYRSCGV